VDAINFGGGGNSYGYCLNNPINWIDPRGLDYKKSPYHKLRPGTETRAYNCMGYALNYNEWIPDNPNNTGNRDPNVLPPKYDCVLIDCSSTCQPCYHMIRIYEDKND